MPISVFVNLQKYIIQDSGIGSNMDDVNNHFAILYRYMGAGMLQEASNECYNLYQNIFLMLNSISIEHLSFCCFVHSIDDEEIKDFSESNLRLVSAQLGAGGVTQGDVDDILTDLKKKLTNS
jgi:hypothetical protein